MTFAIVLESERIVLAFLFPRAVFDPDRPLYLSPADSLELQIGAARFNVKFSEWTHCYMRGRSFPRSASSEAAEAAFVRERKPLPLKIEA